MNNKVAFDIGNVICHVHIDRFFDHLVSIGVASSSVEADDFLSGIQYPQDLGLYNIRQGFYRFSNTVDSNKLDSVYSKWIEIIEPSIPILSFVEELINKGVEVALLSNIGFDHAILVRKKCAIFQKCIQHFSCEVGARKPSRLFFQSFVMSNIEWGRGIDKGEPPYFFDDRQDNIDASGSYFKGIKFDLDDYKNDQEAVLALREHLSDIVS